MAAAKADIEEIADVRASSPSVQLRPGSQAREFQRRVDARTALEQGPEGGLASLVGEIRQLPASMSLDQLEIYESEGKYAFAMPGVEIKELVDSVVFDEDGDIVVEEIGLLQEKGPELETLLASQVAIPSNRSFGLVRQTDGFYSWRSGNIGRVRIYWSKDFVEDSNGFGNEPDWMIYSAYTEAEVFPVFWESRWVWDVDTINGVTEGSAWAHIADTPRSSVQSPQSGCSVVTVGAFGVEVGLETCAGTTIKGDRVGGKHVEFRNDNVWYNSNHPIIDETRFWTGYSQEVKTKSNYAMFWWDYGDACFDRGLFSGLGCDEEVIR